MSDALKIITSETCGNVWIGIVGTLYTIQVGSDEKNIRTAFKQFPSDKCAWVKKGREEEAWKLVESDPAETPSLFDKNEPQEILTSFLKQSKTPCSRPDGSASVIKISPRKACG